MKRALKRTVAHFMVQPRLQHVILAYHSVGSMGVWSQPVEAFERQMTILKLRSTVVPLSTINSASASTKTALVSVTFDDGFEDVYRHAFPIMGEKCIPFTVFIPTDFIERGSASFDWSPHYAGLQPMAWGQMREMMKRGCVVGSHTHSHTRLAQCDTAQIKEELVRSKRILEDKLAVEVNTLAYPFGQPHDYDRRATEIAGEAGYTSAYTTLQTGFTAVQKSFEIPRIVIDPTDSEEEFIQKITGKRNFVAQIEQFNSQLVRKGIRSFPVAAPQGILTGK